MLSKAERLAELEKDLIEDTNLPLRESNLVFGEGDIDAKVLFIGEAPGERENELRRPFVGRAGQLLNKVLEEIGWKRESVYITNIVKRRPPGNRDPLPEEIDAYKPYLTRQIDILNPAVIVPLGRFSMNYFLPTAKISRDQGKLFRGGRWFVYPSFHPAAALRSTGMMNAFRGSFHKLPAVVRKCESMADSEHDPAPQRTLEDSNPPPSLL